jgi:hypothetical protein
MTTRENMQHLARQEAAKTNANANYNQESKETETMNEQLGQILEELKKFNLRLEHVEKNLILQQPNIVEVTKQLYPHVEAVVNRCQATETRQNALEERMQTFEAYLDENLTATQTHLEKQTTDFKTLTEHLHSMTVNEYLGFSQTLVANVNVALRAEASCQSIVLECQTLAEQCSQGYETTSTTIKELAETSTAHLTKVRDDSARTIEQSRVRFVQMFRRLDMAVGGYPILAAMIALIVVVFISAGLTATMSWKLTNRMIATSAESSALTTQETLKPVLETIEKQTQGWETLYQQSEAFDYYLTTLPGNQRSKKRWELIEGMRQLKLKQAENMRKESN